MTPESEYKLKRRVAGYHDIRMDGLTDLVLRANGARVLDLGCNRGLIGFEMANNGAAVVHGCDIFAEGINTARELFIDLRNVESRFEIVDLTKQIPFPDQRYDIVLMIATYHKLKRVMAPHVLSELMINLIRRTDQFFCWRGNANDKEANEEMAQIDRDFGDSGFKRVHITTLSLTFGLGAIWAKYE